MLGLVATCGISLGARETVYSTDEDLSVCSQVTKSLHQKPLKDYSAETLYCFAQPGVAALTPHLNSDPSFASR